MGNRYTIAPIKYKSKGISGVVVEGNMWTVQLTRD